jgi:hypothetical protein
VVVLVSEVGFCGFGWVVLRLFVLAVLRLVLERLDLFLLRRLRENFFVIVDIVTITRGRLHCLILSSVWNQCSLATYSAS